MKLTIDYTTDNGQDVEEGSELGTSTEQSSVCGNSGTYVLPTLQDALDYIENGLAIIPLFAPLDADTCSCSFGKNCKSIGKHPRGRSADGINRGVRGATTNEQQIRTWFAEGGANIGLALGSVSHGLTVLDIDDPAIAESFLADGSPILGETRVVRTGKGAHIYLRTPNPKDTRNIVLQDGRRVGELRGANSYVVAPPSVHRSGKHYEWVNPEQQSIVHVEDVYNYVEVLMAESHYRIKPLFNRTTVTNLPTGELAPCDPVFPHEGFHKLNEYLTGTFPPYANAEGSLDRSLTLIRIVNELCRCARLAKFDLDAECGDHVDMVAGVLKKVDAVTYQKWTHDPNSDARYRTEAKLAITRMHGLEPPRLRPLEWLEDDADDAGNSEALVDSAEASSEGDEVGQSEPVSDATESASDGDEDKDSEPIIDGTESASDEVEVEPAPEVIPYAFPIHVLPKPAADLVRAVSASIPCLPFIAAQPVLATMAAALGAARRLKIKPGYEVYAPDFFITVARAGTGKSPAQRVAVRPLVRRNEELLEEHKAALEEYGNALAAWNKNKEGERGEHPERPAKERLVVADATTEAIIHLLQNSPRGLFGVYDELTLWARQLNQYKGSKGSDRSHWLSMWSHHEITVERKGTPETVYVKNPCVTLVGGITPLAFKELRASDDGLIDRMLAAVSDNPPLSQPFDETGIDEAVTAPYDKLIRKLLDIPLPDESASDDQVVGFFEDPPENPPVSVRLSDNARAIWKRYHDALDQEITVDDLDPMLRDAWSKMKEHAGRLCLMLHMAKWVCGETASEYLVDVETVKGAWELIEFYKAHARVARQVLGKTAFDDQVSRALVYLQKKGGSASVRDFMRDAVAGLKDRGTIVKFLRRLEGRGHGYVEERHKSIVFHLRKQ